MNDVSLKSFKFLNDNWNWWWQRVYSRPKMRVFANNWLRCVPKILLPFTSRTDCQFFVPVLLPKSFWFKLDWSFLFPPSLPATLIQLNKNKNTFSIATKGFEPWTYSIGSNPLPTEPQPIGFTRKQQFRLFLILFVTDCSLEWPDLAKFRHFGTILGKFLRDYLVFGKILILLWQNYLTIGQVFIVVDGQIV